MSYQAAIAVVLASGILAAIVAVLIHRVIALDVRKNHHDVGSVIFLQLGVVFAVLLAFVFSDVWEQYNEAGRASDLEVGALGCAAIETSTLPQPQADAILSAERAYVEAVAYLEWPTMARTRGADDQTDLRLQALITSVARLHLAGADDNATKDRVRQLLSEAHAQRDTRIFQADNGIPEALWIVLIGFSLLLIVSVAFSGIDNRLTLAMLAFGFSTAIVSILVIARLLDYPFEGGLALSPRNFVTLLDKISNLLGD